MITDHTPWRDGVVWALGRCGSRQESPALLQGLAPDSGWVSFLLVFGSLPVLTITSPCSALDICCVLGDTGRATWKLFLIQAKKWIIINKNSNTLESCYIKNTVYAEYCPHLDIPKLQAVLGPTPLVPQYAQISKPWENLIVMNMGHREKSSSPWIIRLLVFKNATITVHIITA